MKAKKGDKIDYVIGMNRVPRTSEVVSRNGDWLTLMNGDRITDNKIVLVYNKPAGKLKR